MFHEYEYYRVGKLDVEYARDPENVFIFFLFLVQILLLWGYVGITGIRVSLWW